jgi:hypothetical protein
MLIVEGHWPQSFAEIFELSIISRIRKPFFFPSHLLSAIQAYLSVIVLAAAENPSVYRIYSLLECVGPVAIP